MCRVARVTKCVDCGATILKPARGRIGSRCKSCAEARKSRPCRNCTDCGVPCHGDRCRQCGCGGWNRGTSKYPMKPCRNCGKCFRLRPDSRVHFCGMACKRAAEAQAKRHTCEHCGCTFERQPRHSQSSKCKDKLRVCSPKCAALSRFAPARRKQAAVDLAAWFHEWDGQRKDAERCNAWKCQHCGATAGDSVDTNRGKYCSPNCYRAAVVAAACVDCGESFGKKANSPASRCESCQERKRKSDAAKARRGRKWRKGNHRKRCQHYGVAYDASITAAAVFKRDGYTCRLCGRATLRKFARDLLGQVDGSSPTIDHIVPLHWREKGHTWDNVRLCCWDCNCVVRNRKGHGATMKGKRGRA